VTVIRAVRRAISDAGRGRLCLGGFSAAEEAGLGERLHEVVVVGDPGELKQFGLGGHVGPVAGLDVERVPGLEELFAAVRVLDADFTAEEVAQVSKA
jgi:hypothetical protein